MSVLPYISNIFSICYYGVGTNGAPSSSSSNYLHLTVAAGRSVYLRPEDFDAVNPFPRKESCKVEVIQYEPATQIFGQMKPKVFDCRFTFGRVIYEHFGLYPDTVSDDRIRLRIADFSSNLTKLHEIEIIINVAKDDDGHRLATLVTVRGPLIVDEQFGLSRPIDHRVLEFSTNDSSTTDCRVRLQFDRGWPRHGRMVSGIERRTLAGQDLAATSCVEFLYSGLRYEHLKPPTPNVDHIGLLVEVEENGVQHRERVQLKVFIRSAFPNILPRLSASSSLNFHVQHDTSGTVLTSAVLMAEDDESPPELLIFNLTKGFSVFQGDLYHVADKSRGPLTSFTQDDLLKNNVAYCPPALLYYDRLKFQIRFDILDGDFGVSETPATVNVDLQRRNTSLSTGSFQRPRISVGSGLVVLEGQSRPLHADVHIRITMVSSSSTMLLAIIKGPKHGRLMVDGRQENVIFDWSQLERQLVVYENDGGDYTEDSIELKMSGDPDILKIVFPISVIPEDDGAPQLIVNTGLKLADGETIAIPANALQTVDTDSVISDVTYVLIERPLHGTLFIHRSSFSVSNFTQADIDDGRVFYRHHGGGGSIHQKATSPSFDQFKIRLQDSHQPPNRSPLYTVHVEIEVHDNSFGDRLRPVPESNRKAFVLESEVLVLYDHMLKYSRWDGREVDVTYDVVGPVQALDESQDGGKLVLLDRQTHVTKNKPIYKSELSRLPEAKSFRQSHVSDRRVVYVPPRDRDVGPTLLRVTFLFSVRETYGNASLHGQFFNITVFPVNDKRPLLYTGLLVVPVGGSSVVSAHAISAVDDDTPAEDLSMTLVQLPSHGTVLVNQVPLAVGRNFTTNDILHSRITYAHRGLHPTSDRIHVMVSDGVHGVSGSILVQIVRFASANVSQRHEAETEEGLTINEGEDIIITPEVLIGDVSEMDDDSSARFVVIQNPNLGSIQVQGASNDVFTKDDLTSGRVKYVQNSSVEIGRSSQLDDIHFMVVSSDMASVRQQHGRSGGSDEPVHTLRITILPVDNAAPRLELGPHVPLVVPEGATVPLGRHVLKALDLDSKLEDVAIVVARAPLHGYLTNVRLARDPAGIPVPISSFRLEDLDDEMVHYVQSVYRNGSEPANDSFVFYATDGRHRSRPITLDVTVVPLNDEPPVLLLQNFTVTQRGEKILDANILRVSDADRPGDRILIRMQSPPRHGQVFIKAHSEREQKFSELDWNDFGSVTLVYRHGGISTKTDDFTLVASDGVHVVTRTAFVEVRPLDIRTRTARVVKNKGIRDVAAGDFRFMSNTALNAEAESAPVDSSWNRRPISVRFLLKRAPRHGVLQLFQSSKSWTNITTGGTFTQQDIDSLSLRYLHTDQTLPTVDDDFGFVVFTGDVHPHANAVTETFRIELKRDQPFDDVSIIVAPIEVDVGSEVILGPSVIQVDPGDNDPNDVSFRIIVQPTNGRVVRVRQRDVSIESFTLTDIHGQRVAYVHSGDTATSEDQFRIRAVFGTSGADASGPTSVAQVTVQVKSPMEPSDFHRTDSIVVSADTGLVNLKTIKFGATDSDAVYSLLEEPKFGSVLLDGRPITASGWSFAQRHVDNGRVVYKRHVHSGFDSDMLHFRVASSSSTAGDRFQKVTSMHDLRVEVVVDTTSQVEILPKLKLISPDTLENFDDDEATQGFSFTNNHIQLSTSEFVHGTYNNYRYVVKTPPKYGILMKLPETGRSSSMVGRINTTSVHDFTQKDVDNGLIRYILRPEAFVREESTSDSFELSVVDVASVDSITDATMELLWSLVYFMQTEYGVCEDVGKFSLPVYRASNLDGFSSVGIRVVRGSGTARNHEDYELSRTRTIEFDPGVTSVNWDIDIVNDGVKEDDVETLIVHLQSPENAVIYGGGKVTIDIYDKNKDSCARVPSGQHQLPVGFRTTTSLPYSHPSTTTTAAPVAANPVCNRETIGTPLSITIGTSTVNLVCDGKTWSTPTAAQTMNTGKSLPARDKKTKRERTKKSKSNKAKELE